MAYTLNPVQAFNESYHDVLYLSIREIERTHRARTATAVLCAWPSQCV